MDRICDGLTDRSIDRQTFMGKTICLPGGGGGGGIIQPDISCECSARQKTHMKYHALFSSK